MEQYKLNLINKIKDIKNKEFKNINSYSNYMIDAIIEEISNPKIYFDVGVLNSIYILDSLLKICDNNLHDYDVLYSILEILNEIEI